MALIRFVLGRLIQFFNWLFTPRSVVRSPDAQTAIDAQTASLVLHQYEACPFCVKVRRTLKRHALKIETRDVKRNRITREELLAGGGELQVPCLRIERVTAATGGCMTRRISSGTWRGDLSYPRSLPRPDLFPGKNN